MGRSNAIDGAPIARRASTRSRFARVARRAPRNDARAIREAGIGDERETISTPARAMTRADGRRRRARGGRARRARATRVLGTCAVAAARLARAVPGAVAFSNLTALQTRVDDCASTDPTFATCVDNGVAIGSWDVSLVTSMRQLFKDKQSFNVDISAWNVGQVTDMFNMFSNAISFNQNIGGWDVSSVTQMYQMFHNATVFNQDISGWTVAQVRDMAYMFSEAKAFDKDITSWSNYTGSGSPVYVQMFVGATAWNAAWGRPGGLQNFDGPASVWAVDGTYTPPPPSPPPADVPTYGIGIMMGGGLLCVFFGYKYYRRRQKARAPAVSIKDRMDEDEEAMTKSTVEFFDKLDSGRIKSP